MYRTQQYTALNSNKLFFFIYRFFIYRYIYIYIYIDRERELIHTVDVEREHETCNVKHTINFKCMP